MIPVVAESVRTVFQVAVLARISSVVPTAAGSAAVWEVAVIVLVATVPPPLGIVTPTTAQLLTHAGDGGLHVPTAQVAEAQVYPVVANAMLDPLGTEPVSITTHEALGVVAW